MSTESHAQTWARSFWSLIITQFQGAFSDNALKNLVLFLLVSAGLPKEKRDGAQPSDPYGLSRQPERWSMTKVLVQCLMFCVIVMPVFPSNAVFERTENEKWKQSPKELQRQSEFREKINLMGPGAEIRIAMRGSSTPIRYEGTVDEITAESFKLKMKDQTLSIQYGQIETLTLKKQYYRPLGQPDPARVRQIVAGLGAGQKVRVMLVSNVRFSGTIRSFEKENFVISSQPQPVRFSDVKEIEKKHFPTAAKVGISAAVVVGVIAAIIAATWKGPGINFHF